MKALLVLNGKVADSLDLRAAVERFRNAGHEVHVRVTWEQGDALRYAQESGDLGADRIVACGGDGTLNETVHGLLEIPDKNRPVLSLIPLGTANDFGVACGFPQDPAEALRLAFEGTPTRIDVARADQQHFINVASFGFVAAITHETPDELKAFLGGGAYTLMALLRIPRVEAYPIQVHSKNFDYDGDALIGAVCNGRQSGGGQILAGEASLDDGLLDFLLVLPFPLSKIDRVLGEISRAPEAGEFVRFCRSESIEVKSTGKIQMNLDGEPDEFEKIRFQILPRELRIVLPSECPCVSRID